jgi:hypothetical protein
MHCPALRCRTAQVPDEFLRNYRRRSRDQGETALHTGLRSRSRPNAHDQAFWPLDAGLVDLLIRRLANHNVLLFVNFFFARSNGRRAGAPPGKVRRGSGASTGKQAARASWSIAGRSLAIQPSTFVAPRRAPTGLTRFRVVCPVTAPTLQPAVSGVLIDRCASAQVNFRRGFCH